MSTISFSVVAHDLASRTLRGIGNAAMLMAAKLKAASAVMRTGSNDVDNNTAAWNRFRVAADRASIAYGHLNNAMNKMTGDGLRGQGRMWFRLALTGLAMAPAVIGPAVYALGALGGAIVSVVPGAAALGLAMMGTYKNIEKVANGTKQATGPLKAAADAFNQLHRTYKGFLNSTQGPVSNVFTQMFKGASELLPRLVPMTNKFANVLSGFLKGVRKDMQSPAFGNALKWMKDVGAVTFKNLLASGKNLTTFFYNLARSFEKAGVDIKAGWLKNLTKDMSDWAGKLGNSEGFKRLIKFTKENWPKITESLSNLGKALGNITVGMEPIASKALDGLVVLTRELAKVKPEQWTKIGSGLIALSLGVKALGVAAGVLKIAGMMRLFNALGKIGGAAGGAGTGAGLASMGRGLLVFAKGLGAFGATLAASAAIGKFMDKFTAMGPGGFFSPGKNSGGIFGGMQMPKITQWIAGLGDKIKGLRNLDALAIPIRLVPKVLAGGLGDALKGIGKGLLGGATQWIKIGFRVVSSGLSVLRSLGTTLLKNRTVRIVFQAVMGGVRAAIGLFRSVKNKTVRLIGTAATGAWVAARTILRGLRNRTVRLIGTAAVGAWNAARGLLRGIRNKTVRLLGTAATAAWRAGKTLLASIRNKVVKLTATAATAAWSAAKRLLASIRNKIVKITGTAATGAWQAAKALWSSIRDKVVTITTVATTIVKKITGRAAGGPVRRNTPYIVGEVGPELFMPETGGRIVPNHRLGQYAGSRGAGGDTYVINVHGAIDPVATGREVQKALLALKRSNGGRQLGLA